MSYLVLARKFRPQSFSEVAAQEHVTKTLANAIKRNKIAHAYLFSGPRGVGKTSIARIFSKGLNCASGPTTEPCGKCPNCVEITNGTNMAVLEIDGASHNSVENVRDLIDSFRSVPPPGSRYKIYIIDEVHMLSTAAFNALLKSLEEPPPHTIFILATTEPHKIPETVISRCQRHDFRTIGQKDIEQRLSTIALQEKIKIELGALRMIARLAEGSMRDAQTLLERVRSFCDDGITEIETGRLLGTVQRALLQKLAAAIFEHHPDIALELVDEVFSVGVDSGLFLKDFVTYFRELLIARFGAGRQLEDLGLDKDSQAELLRQVEGRAGPLVQDLVQMAREGADAALRSAYPRYGLEALVVRMASADGGGSAKRASPPESGTQRSASSPKTPDAKETPRIVSKSAEPAAEESPRPAPRAAAFQWSGFVEHVAKSGSRILAEQLKRVKGICPEEGILEVSGPEFSVNYLKQADNQSKLVSVLAEFSGAAQWTIKFAGAGKAGAHHPDSIIAQEEAKRASSQKGREQDISNHPGIKTLQKVFPGSKIENIRVKE